MSNKKIIEYNIENTNFIINSEKKDINLKIRNFEYFIQGIIKPKVNNLDNDNKEENINENNQVKIPVILLKDNPVEFSINSKYKKKKNILLINKGFNINILNEKKQKNNILNKSKLIEINYISKKIEKKLNLSKIQTEKFEIIQIIKNNNNINKKLLSLKKRQ